MATHCYPPGLQLNNTNVSDTEHPSLEYIYQFTMALFHPKFMISEMAQIFDIANFPLLGGDVRILSNVIWNIHFTTN